MNVVEYVGKPWVSAEFDCWGLVREFYAQERGVQLPVVTIDATNVQAVADEFERSRIHQIFRRIDEPVHGCAVALSQGRRMNHCGVYLDINGGSVLHNLRASGVVFEPLHRMRRIWNVLGFYALRDLPS